MPGIRLAILAAFVLLPSGSYHEFNGVPLDSLPTYLLLLAVAPILGWPWLRAQWRSTLAQRSSRALTFAVAIGVVAKCALFLGGGFDGFAACYRALDEDPRVGVCEPSYTNPFGRFQATRVDRQIDFGPRDWNLSFVNDNRFNYYNWVEGTIPRWRIPFSAHWRGTISHPSDREIAVTYVGGATIQIGSKRIALEPSYEGPRTVDFSVPGGRHRLLIAYTFDDEARIGPSDSAEDRGPVATFRLRLATEESVPLRADPPPVGWRAIGYAVDLLSVGVAFGLLWFYGTILVGQWPLLLVSVAGAWLVYFDSDSFQVLTADGTVVLSLFVLALAALPRRARNPAFCAVACGVALVMLASEVALAGSVQAVFLRIGGTDALTYESFAHEMLDTWSLRGGADVFYDQPLFRHVRFVEHLLLGDGDVLVTAFARTLLLVSALWMIWRFRVGGAVSAVVSVAAMALLLVLLNSVFIADLVRQGHTEYPPLVALPLFFALLFGRRRAPSTLGAGLAAAALIARFNQAPALLWLLGCHLWSLVRRQRREAALAAAVVVVIVLLPASHNLYYGGELVFTTGSIGVSENIAALPDDHQGTWDDIVDRAIGQLGGVLYDHAADERHPQDGGGLRPVFRGLQILWILAIVSVFVSRSPRIAGRPFSVRLTFRPWRGAADLRQAAILFAPLVFLVPHLFYLAIPRHIVIAYVAMAGTALYAVGVVRPGRVRRGECTAASRCLR